MVLKLTLYSKTLSDLLNSRSSWYIKFNANVYYIPCKDCKLKYIGKTSRNIYKHLYEHKSDIRSDNLNNALCLHISKTDHNFDFNAATMLAHIYNKRLRHIF